MRAHRPDLLSLCTQAAAARRCGRQSALISVEVSIIVCRVIAFGVLSERMYCGANYNNLYYAAIWEDFYKAIFYKLKVCHNNIMRRLVGVQP